MTTLTTRTTKGSELSYAELDANFDKAAQTKAGNYTIQISDNRDTIEFSATATATIPDIATLVAASDTGDFEVTLKNVGSGSVTVTCTTVTDTIDGSTADITLAPQESTLLKSNQAGSGVNRHPGMAFTSAVLNEPDINNATDITMDRATTQRNISWTNGGADSIRLYGNPVTGDWNVGLYDDKNTRSVWNYSEATNAFQVTATLQATSAALTTPTINGPVSGDVINTKIVNIGDWNMDTTNFVSVAHGLTFSKIRHVSVAILLDDDIGDILYIPQESDDFVQIAVDATNVDLTRTIGGTFDTTNFDKTPFNRGYITIGYVA